MAIQVAINGCAGRMGRRILALLLEDPELSLAGVLEAADHPSQGQDAGSLVGKPNLGVLVTPGLEGCAIEPDVVIDFTTPSVTLALAQEAGKRKKSMVIGTTGLTDDERSKLADSLSGTTSVLAPNMSVGVNVLFKVAHDVARTLGPDYDMEIVEAHHRFKADAPSGTALRLAEAVAEARGIDLSEKARYGREGRPGARDSEEVGVFAVRAGDIVGEHTVVFGGIGERLELIHRAHTRDNFALGALRAAKWVAEKPSGMYDMMDVLGLR